ncbi:glucose-1-phosphate cytidylyltransferase [Roseomonas genomospecies 6]|uniref:Glucose-1-phosphate cytidylyltransferase n=1 Tax=Roseomonas genomospecies 6 TaxID=214106 RepID=A0A9W7KT36_9PROT|nr:glucose-1-phosphate cytidylyltransferase [Roseomonas genomospecies 6]KAA0678249.1 glucose-1-phosphate cytidylyltransferase [Roseomonas genomospecies 6]
MKAMILAGGLGTRLAEETTMRPKPMVEIGGRPIIWHILNMYSAHGINDFVICVGYKGYMIKEYFANYALHMSDLTISNKDRAITYHASYAEDWRITVVDTGETTMTGGRIKRALRYVADDEAFCMTYGDGLSDVNISELVDFHRSRNRLATVTAVHPTARFGRLEIVDDEVRSFVEKPVTEGGWINGGFFVLSPKVAECIDGDETIWEYGPLDKLAQSGQLNAYRHEGFWQPMDTLRDRQHLEELWKGGKAPWQIWQKSTGR